MKKLGSELREMGEMVQNQENKHIKNNWFYRLWVRWNVWLEFLAAKNTCKFVAKRGGRHTNHYLARNTDVNVLTGLASRLREEEMNITIEEKDDLLFRKIRIEW